MSLVNHPHWLTLSKRVFSPWHRGLKPFEIISCFGTKKNKKGLQMVPQLPANCPLQSPFRHAAIMAVCTWIYLDHLWENSKQIGYVQFVWVGQQVVGCWQTNESLAAETGWMAQSFRKPSSNHLRFRNLSIIQRLKTQCESREGPKFNGSATSLIPGTLMVICTLFWLYYTLEYLIILYLIIYYHILSYIIIYYHIL